MADSHKKSTANVVYFAIPSASRKLPDSVEGDRSLMMWKELLREGTFVSDGEEATIDEAFLSHIVDVFRLRQKKGIEVPCPLGHTIDPEKKRGKVVYVELRPGENGKKSLWGVIEFIDQQAKDVLQHTDVSVGIPTETYDGDGQRHENALEHVAFTDYPVVAGMEKFQDVVFSLKTEPIEMEELPQKVGLDFDTLLVLLGLDEDVSSPTDAFKKILALVQNLKAKAGENQEEGVNKMAKKKFSDEEEKKLQDEEKEFDNGDDEKEEEEEKDFSTEEDEEEKEFSDEEDEKEEKLSKKKCSRKKGANFSLLKENRELKIEKLLHEGYITPAQAREMQKMYCSDNGIQFALEAGSNRDFQNMCELLKKGNSRDVTLGKEKTGFQFSEKKGGKSPLVALMEEKFAKKG
ncbi:MAG: hypothetical protein Q4D62_12915 [Planctomycetia bacterium]|nr:hypothetical protein [Planctomycetia bacterium]